MNFRAFFFEKEKRKSYFLLFPTQRFKGVVCVSQPTSEPAK